MNTFDISKCDINICKLSKRWHFCYISKLGCRWVREHFLIGVGFYEWDEGQRMIRLAVTRWWKGRLSLTGKIVGVELFSRFETHGKEAAKTAVSQGPSAFLEDGEGWE